MGNTVLYCHSNLSLIMIRVNYIAVAQIGFVGVWRIKFVVQYLLYRGNKNKLTNFQKLLFLLLTDFFNYPHSRNLCHWDQQLELTTSQMYICSNTIGCILIFWKLSEKEFCRAHWGGNNVASYCLLWWFASSCWCWWEALNFETFVVPFPSNHFYFPLFNQIPLKV